ncbi:MAG: 3-hydroxyacyl-CoA dehydrogenase NAD-binding domain-containing protein, partial [Xanthobacteraceae bacterium]
MGGARIAVIGAGRMGHGIAWRFAAAGHQVRIQDSETAALDALSARLDEIREALDAGEDVAGRIKATSDLRAAAEDADFVFEAAPENLPLKQALFGALEAQAPGHAILCSNTSAIPIAQIAEQVAQKHRVVGTHFWNPPYLVDL